MAQLVDCLTARDTAVLVIDMQGDFLDEGSPLAPLRGAELARSSAEFLEACRGMGVPVVHAIMEFRADGLDTPDNIGLLFEGLGRKLCVAGTDGALPAPGCEPQAGEPVVKRQHYSAFWCSNLDVVLRSLHVSNLAMFGPLVDLGVHATSTEAITLGYNPIVLKDLCGARGWADCGYGALSAETTWKATLNALAGTSAQVMGLDAFLQAMSN